LVDGYTRYYWIETFNTRSGEALVNYLRPLIGRLEKQLGKQVMYWRTDQAKKFKKGPFQRFLKEKNIEWESGIPYAHHQLGVVERGNRTITNAIATILIDIQLPQTLWVELAKTAIYLRNRSPSKPFKGMTPYQAL
jgi:hypothetical protein